MTGDLELTVLQAPDAARGAVASLAITDQLLVAVGGRSNHAPTVLASSNARRFELRTTPAARGLRDVIVVGDATWTCGEYGLLAVSPDHGATWSVVETGTDGCLFALALAGDGAVWVVGDDGFVARVRGAEVARVELGTRVRLSSIIALGEELVVLGFDGTLRRWADGRVTEVVTGATRPLTSLAITRAGTWVVIGDGGFVARSPDGLWFSRATSGVEIDLEAITTLADHRLVIVGDRGQILVSGDDGRTWRRVPSPLGLAHLWSVERFGGGALIGGDDGLIVRLAPPGDATWSDRLDVFGGVGAIDDVFAGGPRGFIERGLPAYLTVIAGEVAAVDGGDATAEVFHAIYGVALPAEAEALFAAVRGHERWRVFDELRLDAELLPDHGDHNLFEQAVCRNQQAYLGTELVEAFCGVFGLGSQGNGDTYHMEIYEWDGPRQVLHFDHETATFSGVFADALDSLVYLAAIMKAKAAGAVSADAHELGIRALRGKVCPTWHFPIDAIDPGFVRLEPKRRDTEFFFYRSRWICALLKNDGVTELDDLPELFMADLNQVIPPDQLSARYEACERFIPTALYAMWRAYLFDEPELERYLETRAGPCGPPRARRGGADRRAAWRPQPARHDRGCRCVARGVPRARSRSSPRRRTWPRGRGAGPGRCGARRRDHGGARADPSRRVARARLALAR